MIGTLERLVADLCSGAVRVVDLTGTLSAQTPVIALPAALGQSPGVSIEAISRYDEAGPAWYWNAIRMGEHTGTHFDAPVHWISGRDRQGGACDTIEAGRFIGPACVIDVAAECGRDPDFLLEAAHILAWEKAHGRIARGSWVLMRSGWSGRGDSGSFINADGKGPHWPGPSATCVRLLAVERDVLGFGVETIGTDAGQAGGFDPPYPNHSIMHGSGKFGLASLCRLEELPATGAVVIAAPLKIKDGSGSPLRVIALVPGVVMNARQGSSEGAEVARR